jgi:peptidoglycan/LPS O-acetylase OafA/YrhL
MIQRIQTIWLLLAAACAFLTLKLSFYSGNKIVNNQKQFVHLTANENMLLTILSVAVGIAALILVFLYKDRKMQLRLTIVTFLVSIVDIILYFSAIKNYAEGFYDITAFIVFLIPVFLLLAARGIYKDQKLIKSVDRLR